MNKYLLICFFILLFCIICRIYICYRARRRIRFLSATEKTNLLNKELNPWGFAYDSNKQTFYSLINGWQRSFGYGRIYDESAPFFNMIIDCEPIYFVYDNRKWLVELWKGQYGILTGAEIGIYNKTGTDIPKPGHFDNDIYESVTDEEMIDISFVLSKNETSPKTAAKQKTLLYMHQRHWWLTGFRLAQYAEPSDLTLHTQLTFHTCEMRDAFINALLATGYTLPELDIMNLSVTFSLTQPKQTQPRSRSFIRTKFRQWLNRCNVRLFLFLTRSFDNPADRILFLKYSCPILFRILWIFGRFQKHFNKTCKKQSKHTSSKN